MSRLTDDDLRRLAATLSNTERSPAAARRGETLTQRAEIERLQSELGKKSGDEAVGRALTQSLAAYLNRPVRVVAGGATSILPEAWRYASSSGPVQWWIAFEPALSASFADAMLGGAGAGSRLGTGRRAHSLVAKIADLFFESMSAAVDSPRPDAAVWCDDGQESHQAQIAGRCTVAAEPFSWQAGVIAADLPEAASYSSPSEAPRTSTSYNSPLHLPVTQPAAADIRDTIVEACGALFDVLGCPIVVARPDVTQIDDPELPDAALCLALTAGGTGALVVCAQRDAVNAFASIASRATIPERNEIGSVVCAAAEAVVREIVHGIASRLPAISDAPQRTVHIAADAQLARTQHLSADVTLHFAGNAANVRVLVPSWMAGQT